MKRCYASLSAEGSVCGDRSTYEQMEFFVGPECPNAVRVLFGTVSKKNGKIKYHSMELAVDEAEYLRDFLSHAIVTIEKNFAEEDAEDERRRKEKEAIKAHVGDD